MGFASQRAGTIALLTLLPAVIFNMTRDPLAGVVTAVNVLLTSTTTHLLMSPTEGGYGHDGNADPKIDAEYTA